MTRTFHNGLLRFAHFILIICLIGAGVALLILLGSSFTALSTGSGSVPTVTIKLNTSRPHDLTLLDVGMTAYEAGSRGIRDPSDYYIPATYSPQASGYELHANQHEQLLRYAEPSAWKRLLLLQLGFTDESLSFQSVAFLLAGSWLLLLITRNVRQRGAFTAANARYIWWLGLLLIATDVYEVVAYWLVRFVVPPFGAAGLVAPLNRYVLLNGTLDYGGWVAGVMLLIVALVYRRGVELHQEAELTV